MDTFCLAQIDKERCLSWTVDKPPCQDACPLDIDIEGYIQAIAEGQFDKAMDIIKEKCPFPSICGRVCHHPCESACKRGQVDEPIAIEALKRFATDVEHVESTYEVTRSRPESIGIIGSGPVGLTAAHDLAKMGYGATIYEAMAEPGGMLALGIPEFKIPLRIVQKEVNAIKALGVEIKTGIRVGTDVTLADLQKEHKALLIATGLHSDVQLSIPGTDLEGVMYALSLLKKAKLGEAFSLQGKVAVIGGGNGAIDAARTARRMGAHEVHLISTRKRNDMPALERWIQLAETEGVTIHYSLIPEAIRSRDGKRVSQIDFRCVIYTERDEDGRVTRILGQGPEAMSTMEVDHLIIAIGQKPDLSCLSSLEVRLNQRGAILADPLTRLTSVDGVFAAGDVADGPRTVTDSMAAGRRAAASIDLHLQGKDIEKPKDFRKIYTGEEIFPEISAVSPAGRVETQSLPIEERVQNFKEVDLGCTREEAAREAARCLRCGTCMRCFEQTRCVALSLAGNNLKESPLIDGRICVGCGRCARACIYQNIHLTEFS